MIRKPLGVFGLLQLVLTIAAAFFSGVTAFAAEPVPNESAQVLTPELAARILGAEVEPAARNSEPDIRNGHTVVSQCSYSIKGSGVKVLRVGLLIRKTATREEAKSAFVTSKSIYKGEDVPGLGDAAYRITAPAQLNVLKGRLWLVISAGQFPSADPVLQEKAAREILKNISD